MSIRPAPVEATAGPVASTPLSAVHGDQTAPSQDAVPHAAIEPAHEHGEAARVLRHRRGCRGQDAAEADPRPRRSGGDIDDPETEVGAAHEYPHLATRFRGWRGSLVRMPP